MHLFSLRRSLWPTVLLLNVAPLLAQTSPVPSPAVAPAFTYRSALEGYRKFDDQPVASWSKTNDTVGTIGGWRTYAKEASQPAQTERGAIAVPAVAPASPRAPPANAPAATRDPLPGGAGSHQGHGGKQ